MEDSRFVYVILSTLVSNTAYALIAPFLPIEFDKKGISNISVGLIFAIYSVAIILCSPFVAGLYTSYGYRKIIGYGLFQMGLCFIALGCIIKTDNKTVLFVLALLMRMGQGLSSALVQTTCYVMTTNLYPDQKETLIGYIEATMGIGLILGPMLGSLLYSIFGFEMTFYT